MSNPTTISKDLVSARLKQGYCLTSSQLNLSLSLQNFCKEALNSYALAGMTLGRIAGIGMRCHAFSVFSKFLGNSSSRVLAGIGGTVTEGTVFHLAPIFFQTGVLLQPDALKGSLNSSLVIFACHLAGKLGAPNAVIREVTMNCAIMGMHEVTAFAGLSERQTGSLLDQYLSAQMASFQIQTGMRYTRVAFRGVCYAEARVELKHQIQKIEVRSQESGVGGSGWVARAKGFLRTPSSVTSPRLRVVEGPEGMVPVDSVIGDPEAQTREKFSNRLLSIIDQNEGGALVHEMENPSHLRTGRASEFKAALRHVWEDLGEDGRTCLLDESVSIGLYVADKKVSAQLVKQLGGKGYLELVRAAEILAGRETPLTDIEDSWLFVMKDLEQRAEPTPVTYLVYRSGKIIKSITTWLEPMEGLRLERIEPKWLGEFEREAKAIRRFRRDQEWLFANLKRVVEEYADQAIAIVNQEVFTASNLNDAHKAALSRYPDSRPVRFLSRDPLQPPRRVTQTISVSSLSTSEPPPLSDQWIRNSRFWYDNNESLREAYLGQSIAIVVGKEIFVGASKEEVQRAAESKYPGSESSVWTFHLPEVDEHGFPVIHHIGGGFVSAPKTSVSTSSLSPIPYELMIQASETLFDKIRRRNFYAEQQGLIGLFRKIGFRLRLIKTELPEWFYSIGPEIIGDEFAIVVRYKRESGVPLKLPPTVRIQGREIKVILQPEIEEVTNTGGFSVPE